MKTLCNVAVAVLSCAMAAGKIDAQTPVCLGVPQQTAAGPMAQASPTGDHPTYTTA
jgi:hypothetical protein